MLICAVPKPGYPDGRTGTLAGVRAHHQARQPLCDACAEVNDEGEDGLSDPLAILVLEALPYEPKRGWRERAACRGLSPSIFIQSVEEAERREPQNPLARQTCEQCSVQIDCAVENVSEEFGVWGGLGISNRRRLLKLMKSVD